MGADRSGNRQEQDALDGGEIGEAADIIKKHGVEALGDEKLRRWLVEELADVLMYYNDILLCYGITPAELKAVYREKFERNMHRW